MASSQFDVLGLGEVAVDELLYVDEYPPAEGKVRVLQRVRQCGGLTGTALVSAARLGAKAAYAGMIGDDPLSREVAACFRREGVDVAHAVQHAEARPAHSTIIVDRAHHTRTIFASADGLLGPALDLPAADLIRSAAVLLVDHHGMPGTQRAVRVARESDVAVVADFERSGGTGFGEVLAEVDHLIISRRFAAELTGTADPAESAVRLWSDRRRVVAITCGAAGGWYYTGNDTVGPKQYPAFLVQVVDTTGCGDVFHGAYAAGLAARQTVAERLARASAAAALKATQRGGQAGIPSRPEVDAFLARPSSC